MTARRAPDPPRPAHETGEIADDSSRLRIAGRVDHWHSIAESDGRARSFDQDPRPRRDRRLARTGRVDAEQRRREQAQLQRATHSRGPVDARPEPMRTNHRRYEGQPAFRTLALRSRNRIGDGRAYEDARARAITFCQVTGDPQSPKIDIDEMVALRLQWGHDRAW